MKYYSTNGKADRATLHEAVVKGLAGDKGLFMPETIKRLPDSFFEEIQDLSFRRTPFTSGILSGNCLSRGRCFLR